MERVLLSGIQCKAAGLLMKFMRQDGKVVDYPSLPVKVINNPPATWTIVHELGEQMTLFRYIEASDLTELKHVRGDWHYVRTGWFVDMVTSLAAIRLADFDQNAGDIMVVLNTNHAPVPFDGTPIYPVTGPDIFHLVQVDDEEPAVIIGNFMEVMDWIKRSRWQQKTLRLEAFQAPLELLYLLQQWRGILSDVRTSSD